MHSTAGGWKRSLRSYGMTASLSASSPVSLSFYLLVSCSLYVRACACVHVRVCAVRVCDRPSFLSCLKITAVTRFEPPAVGLVLKSAAITFVFRLSSSLAQWLAPAPSCWRAYVTFTCLDGCCHVSWLGQALARQLSQTSRQVQMGAPHTSAAGAERLISRPLSAVSLSLSLVSATWQIASTWRPRYRYWLQRVCLACPAIRNNKVLILLVDKPTVLSTDTRRCCSVL